MDRNETITAPTRTLRSVLLDLARRQENLAAHQAATVPYWAPRPSSVVGHLAAAAALRAEADELLTAGDTLGAPVQRMGWAS